MKEIFSHSYSIKNILKIYSLKEFDKESQKEHIGNKAKSLLNLAYWNFNVPDTIILDYSFFDAYNKNVEFSEVINEIIKLALKNQLAIRSSCSLEDSYNESCAGLFKTTLKVPKEYIFVKEAIIDCYQSLLKYIKRNNPQNVSELKMGVIIQSMITPNISGIIFTCPPVNPNDHHYQIEYCSSYGDQLTSGSVSGDSIIIDKRTGKIVQQKGTIFISLNSLNQLWEIIKKLEQVTHFPQDAEFVISDINKQIFLVQSRPITAFQYTAEYVLKNESEKIRSIFESDKKTYGIAHILSKSNIAELFPKAIPLGYSIFRTIFTGTELLVGAWTAGRVDLGYEPVNQKELTQLFLTIGDQARENLLIHSLTYRLKDINKELYLNYFINYYLNIIKIDPEKANYPQDGIYIQNPDFEECILLFKDQGPIIYNYYSQFLNEILYHKIPAIINSIPQTIKNNENFLYTEIYDSFNNKNRKEKLFIRDENGFLRIAKEVPFSNLMEKFNEYLSYLRTDLGVKYVIVARIAFLSSDIVKTTLKKLYKKYHQVFYILVFLIIKELIWIKLISVLIF